MLDQDVKNFYSRLQFPGQYSLDDIQYHSPAPTNPFLKLINDNIPASSSVLDIGCGSGYIVNLMAINNPSCHFTCVDFSDAIQYATSFSKQHQIKNTVYKKSDFLTYQSDQQHDVIICQGVLHHIPKFEQAIAKIKSLCADNGTIILGLYHPAGKILKKFLTLNYITDVLKQDQEDVPFEITFTERSITKYFDEYQLVDQYPKNPVLDFIRRPLQFSKNGGLVTYILKNKLAPSDGIEPPSQRS